MEIFLGLKDGDTECYLSFTLSGDIALLKLRQPVTLSDEIHPICLPDLAPPVPGETCYITGWGSTGKRHCDAADFISNCMINSKRFCKREIAD